MRPAEFERYLRRERRRRRAREGRGVGTVACLVKGIRHAEPHARVRVLVLDREGSRWWFKPPQLKRDGLYRKGGVHFKLLPETFEAN